MKFLIPLFVLCISSVQAQFVIKEDVRNDPEFGKNIFPIIVSKSNPEAALKINTCLHHDLLSLPFDENDTNRFSNIFPQNEYEGGCVDFSYKIITNKARFFSIQVEFYNGKFQGNWLPTKLAKMWSVNLFVD